jgi:hypothetical protein
LSGFFETVPGGSYGPADVRSRIARLASADRVAALAHDLEGKLLGKAPVSRIPSGWRIGAREGAARYEARAD